MHNRLLDFDVIRRLNETLPAELDLTRRQFLGIALAATGRRALGGNPINFTAGDDWFSFSVDGRERWSVNAREFEGQPRLRVIRAGPRLRVQLRGALYPGTQFSADFDVSILTDRENWQATFYRQGAANSVTSDFLLWLLGEERVSFSNPQASTLMSAGDISVRCEPDVEVIWASDGTLILQKSSGLLITLPEQRWTADTISVTQAGKHEPSILNVSASRRTLLFVRSSPAAWQFDLRSSGNRIAGTAFDRLRIDASDECVGAIAEAGQARNLQFTPAGLVDSLGKSGTVFDISEPRFACARAKSGQTEVFISGRFGNSPQWIGFEETGLSLGGQREPFELHSIDGKVLSLQASLTLQEIRVPFEGADATIQIPEGTPVDLTRPQLSTASVRTDRKYVYVKPLELATLRSADLVSLSFRFENLLIRWPRRRWYQRLLHIGKRRRASVVIDDSTKPALLTVTFPPQHINEEAFYDAEVLATSETPKLPGRAQARLSGRSRLVFRVPDEQTELAYTMAGLLDWSALEPQVVPHATAQHESTAEPVRAPSERETHIEFPTDLVLSPNDYSGWAHSTQPRRSSKSRTPVTASPVTWTELWHSRLGSRLLPGQVNEDNSYLRTLRAVWATGDAGVARQTLPPCVAAEAGVDIKRGDAFRAAMDKSDRFEIVHLSSDFAWPKGGLEPKPIQAERFMLSSLGAFADLNASWPEHNDFSVRDWRHVSTGGRDQFVRIVYGGYLYPYGHRANLIQITERKFQKLSADGPVVAWLRQRRYCTVEERIKTFGDTGVTTGQGFAVDRMMPLASIEALTASTPRLDPDPPGSPLGAPCALWPKVGGEFFQFEFKSTDVIGGTHTFSSPAIFVRFNRMHERDFVENTVRPEWRKQSFANCPFGRQRVAFAPGSADGDTVLEAASLEFDAYYPVAAPPPAEAHSLGTLSGSCDAVAPPAQLPNCAPLPRQRKPPRPSPAHLHVPAARVKIPAASQLAPKAAVDVPFKWDDVYLRDGFKPDLNAGEVFGRFDILPELELPNTRSISLFRPDFKIEGLSRRYGSIGDLGGIRAGKFNPADFFKLPSARLFGVIDLKEILGPIDDIVAKAGVPQVVTKTYYDANGLPERVEARMEWKSNLKDFDAAIIKFLPDAGSQLLMELVVTTTIRSAATTSLLVGELTGFKLTLVDAVHIHFVSLRFASASGEKPDVKVSIDKIEFDGALSFVAKLAKFLPAGLGGGNGPKIAVGPDGIVVTMGLRLPNVTFGVFSLLNLRVFGGLELPLTPNTPLIVRFAFGDRNDPVLVVVTIFGGGFYAIVSLDGNGIRSLDVAIEFGGVAALDLGVARGTAYCLAGIGMQYDAIKGQTIWRAYLRAGACLDVLGLLTVSIQFTMEMRYRKGDGQMKGICTVVVSIEFLFFDISVPLTLEREFSKGGSDSEGRLASLNAASIAAANDPPVTSFGDIISEQQWLEYCEAFTR